MAALAYLLAHDVWFCAGCDGPHRAPHRRKPCKRARSITPTAGHAPPANRRPLRATAFHPIEAMTGVVAIPLLVPSIPIDIAAPGLVLTAMPVMGDTDHMAREIFPRFM